ncbi:hypothetical protein ABZZ36_18270 [Actinacidiphila glaucinigra]|uniref:hypothetical protein n=1 Tax=Actinacidiphila glaucinigra TaxID=235986 RepID=UPI0033AFF7D3
MNVEDLVQQRIEDARRRIAAAKKRRTAQQAARQAGLAHRHARKLRNLRAAEDREPSATFRGWLGQSPDIDGCATLAAVPGTWVTAEQAHEELHRSSGRVDLCLLLAMTKDAWLAMTDQWQHDCADCRTDCSDERYMVHDEVWAAAGMCPFGFLCIGCIERRLGRRLAAADFLDVPLNYAPGFRRSARLTRRLAHSLPGRK